MANIMVVDFGEQPENVCLFRPLLREI